MSDEVLAKRRVEDLRRYYSILGDLARKCGGARRLAECTGRMEWPDRGVYFFQEDTEMRTDSGTGPRIVRVGTHALSAGSRTTLWNRLSQHRGQAKSSSGNHRGSIFRLLVGTALLDVSGHAVPSWGQGSHAGRDVREKEQALEQRVSQIIGAMPFLWLAVNDPPGPESLRGYIERNAIALLSNYDKPALDPPSAEWLGRHCNRVKVRESGLWNQNHVEEKCDPAFLDTLAKLVAAMAGSP